MAWRVPSVGSQRTERTAETCCDIELNAANDPRAVDAAWQQRDRADVNIRLDSSSPESECAEKTPRSDILPIENNVGYPIECPTS
jgi:hypothetical protein